MLVEHVNLARIDLNLLVVLDALLSERSVTRAAGRLNLGQSTMSHHLGRLRALLRDELLVRGSEGMRLTPRALALIVPVRMVLAQVETLVAPQQAFEPRTAERLFRIGLPDSAEVLLGPALLARLAATAPGVRLRFHSTDNLFEALDEDRFHLGIGVGSLVEAPNHHKRRLLTTDSYLCMFNAARVGLKPPISLADYVRLPHLLTSLREGERGVVDAALERIGLHRTVALTTPRFVAVPFIVAGAPVVTTMHARLARYLAAPLGLSLSPVPVELAATPIALLWHASYDHDPAHRWLRRIVVSVAAEMGWTLGGSEGETD